MLLFRANCFTLQQMTSAQFSTVAAYAEKSNPIQCYEHILSATYLKSDAIGRFAR